MTIMKTEQFQNLNVKQAEEILDVAVQLTDLAEKLFCIVRGVIDSASADIENTWTN